MSKPQASVSETSPETLDRVTLLMKARDEHRQLKEAKAAGKKRMPATPNLDELHRRHATMTTESRNKTAAGASGGARVRLDDNALRMKCGELILDGYVTRASIVKRLRELELGSNEKRVQAAFEDVVLGKVAKLDKAAIGKALTAAPPNAKTTPKSLKAGADLVNKKPSKAVAKQTPGAKARSKQVTPIPKKGPAKAAAKKAVAVRGARKTVKR